MAGKIEERHKALRNKLVDIAEIRVAAGGVEAVKARDLAKEAECALGAIYNVFDDLNDIVLAVNGRTFQQLDAALQHGLQGYEGASATQRLIAIAAAYLEFAMHHPNRWRSLFDVPFSADLQVPRWYWDQLDQLFDHISGPVAECFPEMSQTDQALMTRALFSSVHGIVSLGIENRVMPIPQDQLMRMIELVVCQGAGNK
ncbi:TetR/AcrR family transcriptional regulator [Roseovarius sp. 2305UL8-3]|uniref:TetR/AcrR family transcriptional regulator n=1 Tax=Roseovarius conchicola TaxID=3121636 RepID=UPI00352776FB